MLSRTQMQHVALVLLIIGGLNWGLVAINGADITSILGLGGTHVGPYTLAQIIYVLVALSAVYIALNSPVA